jgi:hypothetical protein
LHAHFKWLLWETNIHLMGLLTSISFFLQWLSTFLEKQSKLWPTLKMCIVLHVCVWTGGALKPSTLMGLWVHITCGWFVPEVRFKDAAKMEPADGLIDINLSTFHQVCQIPIISRIFLYYVLVILYCSCGSWCSDLNCVCHVCAYAMAFFLSSGMYNMPTETWILHSLCSQKLPDIISYHVRIQSWLPHGGIRHKTLPNLLTFL